MQNKIIAILKKEETEDAKPPFRALPAGHDKWMQIKAKQILTLINADLNPALVVDERTYYPKGDMLEGVLAHRKTRPVTLQDLMPIECPDCADGYIPTMPDGEPEPHKKCNATGKIYPEIRIKQ